MTKVMSKLKEYVLKLNNLIELFFIPFMGAMMFIILLQVVARFIPGLSLPWTEEVSIYMMIWGAFLGGGIGLAKGKHIAITMFYNMMPTILKKFINVIKVSIVLFYIFFLVYYGYFYAQTGWTIISPATRIPSFWVFIAIPIGGILMLLQLLINPTIYQKEATVEAVEEEIEGKS